MGFFRIREKMYDRNDLVAGHSGWRTQSPFYLIKLMAIGTYKIYTKTLNDR